jgi:hypothetical protein
VTIERPRYFSGQALVADDLEQEQLYLREKARRHNRLLHGFGVVCGLCVRPDAAARRVIVEPGYALDPYGEEILVEHEVAVELCRDDDDGNAVSARPERRGSAGGRHVDRPPGRPMYLAIRHAESVSRPVPVSDGVVDYSRTREGFSIKVLTALPQTDAPPRTESLVHPCPKAPSDPWVILAEIVIDSALEIAKIDCVAHRSNVGHP